MLRQLLTRSGGLALAVMVLAVAGLTTSCGGGGGYAAKDMVLVEFLFVDRALVPTAPTGTENLPRNAQILLVFSEQVNPNSVNDQTVQIRYGPTGQSVPKGSFSIDGNTVRFDPTVTAQGQPNPFGFEPVTQYLVDIPNYEEQPAVIRNLDDDPNLVTFFTTFVTSDGFLRELDPPEVVRVYSIPDRFEVNPLTGQWPGNGLLAIEFNEPMDPASFILGSAAGPDENTSVDVRYVPYAQINIDNGLVNPSTNVGLPIPGSFTRDAAAMTYIFKPTFSFGDGKYVFAVQVFQGLKDLSGNLLVNPRSFGPYTCDGTGIATGTVLEEDFLSAANLDLVNSDGPDWGQSEEGVLQGQEITSRDAYLFGYTFQRDLAPTYYGQYGAIVSPMIGAALNQYVSGITPPTSAGRRVLWAFSDEEMGANGSVTAAGWGPDSNATFAAIYPKIFLRAGFQKLDSLSLSPSFSGNYDGKATVVYTGAYQVPQAANVGNTVSVSDPGGYNVGGLAPCYGQAGWNAPLWDYTGFQPWPDFATYFEWNQGDPNVPGDSVFLFDASCQEGDTWQQVRGWFAMTYPCSGLLVPGFPNRRMYTTYEDDTANPTTNLGLGILNPEPSVTDSAFTITKRISLAQTLFYTDGLQPGNSTAITFGADSDYLQVEVQPLVQSGGAQVLIQFQGAHGCEADRRTPNVALGPMTDWTDDINDCDGFECLRWRVYLISNLISNQRARLYQVVVPVVDAGAP